MLLTPPLHLEVHQPSLRQLILSQSYVLGLPGDGGGLPPGLALHCRPPDGCRGMAPADATAAGKLTGKVHRRTWALDGSARAWHCMSGPTPWDAESPKKPLEKETH